MTDLDQYLTAPQCAELAGIKPDTFTSYVHRGYAPAPVGRIGDRRVWDRDTVAEWVAGRGSSGDD